MEMQGSEKNPLINLMLWTSEEVVGDACVLVVSVCAVARCAKSLGDHPYVSNQMAQAFGSSTFTTVAVMFVGTKV